VMSDPLYSETTGNVYLIPFRGQLIVAQVGMGGDLGVFDALLQSPSERIDENVPLLFRVHFGRASPRKYRWKSLGLLPFLDNLREVEKYSFTEIGSDDHYIIKFGSEDTAVTSEEAGQYEPLATWSHEHIIDRFVKESKLVLPPETQ